MSKHYSYSINLDSGFSIYVTCGGTYYDRELGPIEGVMIQTADNMARFDMALKHFTEISLHHLREQGYLVISPKEMAALGHMTPDDWRADQRGLTE